ncbi:2-oxoacid:ferredoxin oxidoreductase subunit beta [Candidatus Woesearchaeota archaeon]|jgi:2-oxoglutarate/2-oxoacid ferredoxin oxidoreductase subunit beta|nr:2-oxoacid:ferredoxin oxidoreductase subunit beta [Candidatus Woesearchaeota archaeon]
MSELSDYNSECSPHWCPGCGNFGVLISLKRALVNLSLEPHNVFITSGIGCSSKAPHWIKTYGFHGVHGRSLPVATGAKLANHDLTVIAEGGDGDGYGIGLNHFVQSCRRNVNINYFVHNNMIYGLTTGQTSPTSDEGMKTKSTPFGNPEPAINPLAVAIASGATFVARGFAGNPSQLQSLMEQAIKHKGFAFIDILQPCIAFNKLNTFKWYKERCYTLEDHDPKNKELAIKLALEWSGEDNKIATGLFYQEEKRTYEDHLPQIKDTPLVNQPVNPDISKILEEFR